MAATTMVTSMTEIMDGVEVMTGTEVMAGEGINAGAVGMVTTDRDISAKYFLISKNFQPIRNAWLLPSFRQIPS
jgi:hypothetical protein